MQKPVITGVGKSQHGRRLGRSGIDLAIESMLSAVEDAGLEIKDIDGVSNWPGKTPSGFSPVGIDELQEALGLKLNWYSGGREGPGQMSSVINAAAAVSMGLANHVICLRTLTETSGKSSKLAETQGRLDDWMQWLLPFNAFSAGNWMALYAQRYFHEFGATREQLAQIALNARKNAQLNEEAVYRDPLSMEDYLQSRIISTPLCLYDCDVPVDGSTAAIVSRADASSGLRKQPITIEAIGCALHDRNSWDQFPDMTTMACRDAAKMMWSNTDLKPKDVHIAGLYDGFSIATLYWLEALGFCQRGEAAAFIEGGQRISRDGELPLNTNGGQLSEGRLHGFGFLREVCLQIWREAGDRQLNRKIEVGAIGVGGGNLAASLLLTRS